MARNEIPMVINLRQNKNDDSTAYGKYFAEVDSKEPLNLKGFAAHMTSHGKQKRFMDHAGPGTLCIFHRIPIACCSNILSRHSNDSRELCRYR